MARSLLRTSHLVGAFAAAVCLSGPALAANYNEAVAGDLSGDRLNPTLWSLAGSSTVGETTTHRLSGGLGHEGTDPPDRDYVHLVVPKGQVWSSLVVGNSVSVGGTASFIGLASGSTMPVPPDAFDATGLLGWRIYSRSDQGKDILPRMQVSGNGASGFDLPLKAGDYTLWVQELAPGAFKYQFDVVLTAVPEPSTSWLAALGLVGVVSSAARRRREAVA